MVLVIAPLRGGADPADDKQRAAALFTEGRQLASAHDDAGACEKFTAANRLDPDQVGTMLNLGLCHQALGHLKTAIDWFRAAENRASALQLADSVAAARRYETAIVDQVPSVTIKLDTDVNARVELDGNAIASDKHAHVELDPGGHVLDATASGYQPYHVDFRLHPTERRIVRVTLVAHGARSSRRPLGPVVYVGGAGVVALAAGAGVALYAKNEYDKCVVNDMPLARCTGSSRTGVQGANYYTSMNLWVATPLVGAGVIAVGVAAYLYLRPRDTPGVTLVPRIEGDQLGLAASFAF